MFTFINVFEDFTIFFYSIDYDQDKYESNKVDVLKKIRGLK